MYGCMILANRLGLGSILALALGRRNLILRLVDHLSPRRCVCVKT
jgi:hypothetical protein